MGERKKKLARLFSRKSSKTKKTSLKDIHTIHKGQQQQDVYGRKIEEKDVETGTKIYSVNEKDVIFNTINRSGFDYKGQQSSFMCKMTKGIRADISINVGDIFVPGVLDLSVSGSANYMQGKYLLINIETQSGLSDKDKNTYVCLAFMQGKVRDWAIKFGAEVGVSIPGVDDLKKKFDREKGTVLSETMGFSLDVGANASAEAEYKGTYVHICHPFVPLRYNRNEGFFPLKKDLYTYLTTDKLDIKSVKEDVKREICDFINVYKTKEQKKVVYTKSKIRAFFGKGHISSNELVRELKKIKGRNDLTPTLVELTDHYIELILTINKMEKQFNKYASLRLWGHDGQAGTGIKISAGISGHISKAGASVEASLEGPSIKGELKRTSYRYQMMQADQSTIKTQDTVITYKSLQGKWFDVSVSAGVSVELEKSLYENEEKEQEVTVSLPSLEEGIEKGYSKEWCVINQMSYKTAILYWNCIEGTNKKEKDKNKIKVLKGSGLCYGQSINADNFLKALLIDSSKEAGGIYFDEKVDNRLFKFADNYLNSLKKVLNITSDADNHVFKVFLKKVRPFLMSYVEEIEDSKTKEKISNPKDILIEAIFTTETKTVPLKKIKKGLREPDDLLNKGHGLKKGNLQSIRLRYRMREKIGGEKNLFTLGFSIRKTGASVTLKKAEEAGSEGIVDIFTFWASGDTDDASVSRDIYNKPETVPPTVLFYQ